MSNTKTYILQHDLPDSKAGDEYVWDEDECAYYKNGNTLLSYWTSAHVENNPDWFRLKLKEDESIKINCICYHSESVDKHPIYAFIATKRINPDKYPLIIKAIETVINNNSEWVDLIDDANNNRLYTITDMKYTDKDMEDCFNESRVTNPIVGFKYDTYEEYKKLHK